MMCRAIQYSDEMHCAKCVLRWDVNDPDPPGCLGDQSMRPITADEDERLTFLIEEAAEVIQEATKIKRFGWSSYHPDDPKQQTNRERLQSEVADFLGAFRLLRERDGLLYPDYRDVKLAADKKCDRSRFNKGAA